MNKHRGFQCQDVLKGLKNPQLKQEAVNRASENFWKISALQPSWNFESLEFESCELCGTKTSRGSLVVSDRSCKRSKQFTTL